MDKRRKPVTTLAVETNKAPLPRLWSAEEYTIMLATAPSVRGAADAPLFQMTVSKGSKTWLIDDRMSLLQVRVLRPLLREKDYDVKIELIF